VLTHTHTHTHNRWVKAFALIFALGMITFYSCKKGIDSEITNVNSLSSEFSTKMPTNNLLISL